MKVKTVKKRITLIAVTLIVTAIFLPYQILLGGYKKYEKTVDYYCQKYEVSKSLILAVIKTESNFNQNAVSKKGAIGLMQIMPSTAYFVAEKLEIENVNLYNKEQNIQIGTYYLKYLLNEFKNERLAICAYNAGEGNVNKWLNGNLINEIPFKETETYYKKVSLRIKLYEKMI